MCVLCRARPVEPRWRPFCSQRCQQQDQARWADGTYRVPGPPSSTFPRPDRRRRTTMAETLTITDNRTGKQYELPITDGTIRANDLKKIKVDDEDGGLATYDPAFMNTAACRSRITYIDGDKGILLYRGYPIEQLAEHSTYLETAYLILFGELPTAAAARGVDPSDHDAHDGPREHQEVHGGLPVRRPSDGRVHQHRRRAVDVLHRRQADLRRAARASGRFIA